MRVLRKIKMLVSDPDIKEFIKFLLHHPGHISKCSQSKSLPIYIEKYNIKNPFDNEESVILKAISIPTGLRNKNEVLNRVISIHLAGIDINLDINYITWNQKFDDPEDVAAFHRFMWLYKWVFESLTTENREDFHKIVLDIIYSWIESESNRVNGHFEIWQTYTVAERIINWSILLSITSNKEFNDKKIINSIIQQLDYIRHNFEYYGEKFTGNHFCNNGRALYIAGSLLSIEPYIELGKTIILHEFDRIVIDRYFLREGSVHYQFLYTKWFTDLYWIAGECKDTDFQKMLRQCLKRLLTGCRYFLTREVSKTEEIEWEIPYIGDISPDYPPHWLLGVPWVAKYFLDGTTFADLPKQKGYHTLFLFEKKITLSGIIDEIQTDLCISDWGKIKTNHFVLFSHVNHSIYPNNLTGHFHHDSGGFVLYVDGSPFFIDCGRENYDMDGVGLHEKNFTGHNICVVDDLNPEINMRTFFTEEFLKEYAGNPPIIIIDDDHKSMGIAIDGYKRSKGVGKYFRKIILRENKIEIIDKIEGKGKHNITLLFHLASNIGTRLEKDILILDNGKSRYRLCFSVLSDKLRLIPGTESSNYGHCAFEYGKHSLCNTLIYKKRVQLPWQIETKLEIL